MATMEKKKDSFSQSDFKKLSVSDKFKKVFNRFRTNLIVIFVVILAILIILFRILSWYKSFN